MKIRKGDQVKILTGKDQGKTGTVEKIFLKNRTVLVTGLNIYKRHLKPRGDSNKKTGGIIDISRPLSVCKVAVICPKCQQPTRIGLKLDGGEKIRFCHKCQARI